VESKMSLFDALFAIFTIGAGCCWVAGAPPHELTATTRGPLKNPRRRPQNIGLECTATIRVPPLVGSVVRSSIPGPRSVRARRLRAIIQHVTSNAKRNNPPVGNAYQQGMMNRNIHDRTDDTPGDNRACGSSASNDDYLSVGYR
jgi:hypothetical protein